MKRSEFIQQFTDKRRAYYKLEVAAGRMRESEAAMGLADAKRDAIKLWRTLKRGCQ